MSTGIVTFRERLQLRLQAMPANSTLRLGKVVLRRYADCPLKSRTILKLLWWLTPHEAIASRVPTNGLVIELGCGHGLLSMTLANQASRRHVVGIDLDERRIEIAQRVSEDLPNLEFLLGDSTTALARFSERPVGIVLNHVVHQLSRCEQERLLKQMYEQLLPGGVLILREADAAGWPPLRISKVSQWIMRRIRKIPSKVSFTRPRSEWKELLQSYGFGVTSERCGCYPLVDRMYVCLKD